MKNSSNKLSNDINRVRDRLRPFVDRACRADYENRLQHRRFEVEVRGEVGWGVVLALNPSMRVWHRLVELLILDAGGIGTGLG